MLLYYYFQMDARNLAIVFGPTLIRTKDESMVTMVKDMSDQCRIVESVLTHVSISSTLAIFHIISYPNQLRLLMINANFIFSVNGSSAHGMQT